MVRSKLICVVYQIQISLLAKIFQVCFKRGLSVLNTILETLTSFDSVSRDIARSTIDSAIDFNDTSEFKPLVPTCTMKCPGSSLIDSFL